MTINKPNIILDATQLDMLQLCEMRFNYRFNLNKVTLTKAKPLDKGTLVHTGLEYYYKELQKKSSYETAKEAMIAGARLALTENDLDIEEGSRILDTLVENIEYWRAADAQLEILAVEQPFSYILYECDDFRLIMMGKIDLLVNDYPNYMNLPIDHKTYERDFGVKRLTNQFQNYAYACSSNYLRVNRIGFQKTYKPVDKYKRPPLSYDPLILEQWKNNTIKAALRYLNCVAEDSWEMNLTSCDKYNRPCEYLEVCDSSGEAAKVYKLEANFNIAQPWDVGGILSKNNKD